MMPFKSEAAISMNERDDSNSSQSPSSMMGVTSNFRINEGKMEKIWAGEQYSMSQKDREANTHELHGVKSRYDVQAFENPENQFRALVQFDNELNNTNSTIPPRLKSTYFRALSLGSSYVSSFDFRIRFLRAEFFDVHKAVVRFCKCLNMLVDYFGNEALMRQLFLTDLSKRERKLLKEGDMQLSPSRDSLGRRIFFMLGNAGGNYTPRERDKVGLYFLLQVIPEDVTTQQNGLVSVHILSEEIKYSMGGKNTISISNLLTRIFESIPLRFSAVHMCFPNEFLYRLLKPLMLFVVGKAGRSVMRIHSGTTMEFNYSLSSFGIRLDEIPTTSSGNVKTRQHLRWLKVRVLMDEYFKKQCKDNVEGQYSYFYASDKYTIRPFPHIQCPEINSVLFHKNGVAWEFPGNIEFRAFLDEQLPNNSHLNNRGSGNVRSTGNLETFLVPFEKERLFDRIIRLSLAQSFTFLLHDETKHWYTEVKDLDALRRYIGLAIRGRKRRFKAQRERQDIGSDNNITPMNTESVSFTNMDGMKGSPYECCNSRGS